MERDPQYVASWQQKLKLSIVSSSFATIEELLTQIPQDQSVEELEHTQALVGEAIELFEAEQIRLQKLMQNIKNSKQFLSTQQQKKSKEIRA
jgi:hypothetical protein